MAILKWDEIGKRQYETGTSKGVLFVQDDAGVHGTGVPWNGLTSVKQSPDGAEETAIYADNMKYLGLMSAENHKGTIDAYTYPDEFAECDGSAELVADSGIYAGQQERRQFGLVYSTILGNDTAGNAYGEKIHIVYNARVAPSERAYETVNDTPSALTLSWAYTTTPVSHPALKRPTAIITVNTTKMAPAKLVALKEMIYGTLTEEPKMPTIEELIALIEAA